MEETYPILLFDGYCNLCNSSVQWILKRDKKAIFRFASLQSETGVKLRQGHEIPDETDSIVLIKDKKYYVKSTAILHVAKLLGGGWKMAYGFIWVPTFIRDFIYDIVARNRYKWFGKKDSCWLPTSELTNRFI